MMNVIRTGAVWLLALASACATTPAPTTTTRGADDIQESRAARGSRWSDAAGGGPEPLEDQASRTSEQDAWLTDNCVAGPPKSKDKFGPTLVIAREGYALRHAHDDKIPLWVCEHIEAQEFATGVPRHDSWRSDPDLAKAGLPRAVGDDYLNSRFDRGHMAPNADFKDIELREQTFYFSNAVPQNGLLNGHLWADLEDAARQWSKEHRDGVWVITGPLFYDAAEENPATADGNVRFWRIGKNKVSVPTHVYKIVIRASSSGLEAIGFVAKNAPPAKGTKISDWIVPIDWIEAHTGLDFMPGADVDEASTPAMW